MNERWIGLKVSSDAVVLVDAEVPDEGPLVIQADINLPLQRGSRPQAYKVILQQIGDYAREHHIERAIVKASAVSLGGTTKAHLEAAELRGVVLSALAGVVKIQQATKASISRNFGDRKADEYLKDGAFWADEIAGKLRVGSREAALLLLAARK